MEFNDVAVPLGIALGLSLTVERVLEFLKRILTSTVSIEDVKRLGDLSRIHEKYMALGKLQGRDKVQRESDAAAQSAAESLVTNRDDAERQRLITELQKYAPAAELDEVMSSTSVATASATLPRNERVQREFLMQIFGFALGIILARFTELRLFSSFHISGVTFQPWMDYLLTGLLIGGGSAPIHTLIRFISDRKVTAEPEQVRREEVPVSSSAAARREPVAPEETKEATDLARLKSIQYYGGVDREKLEWVHIRKVNPTMIIYHHTAMNRSSSFEDVVNVIKSRKDNQGNRWLTGYHCVVTEDGGIHPFCRWDRSGNHAAGLNTRSLGIAFNGNFETDAGIPFSNPEGRYGPPLPTDEQLDAGARIVALWCHIYGIPLDFNERIIPHGQVSGKSCPGGNFPTRMFRNLVTRYHQAWSSDEAKDYLEAFANKQYIKV
jgi:hypothetical protein